MYRIKTDIRQYKCDSEEKVEKLIRNWVIRPNDLIYLAQTQRWAPIGEHPLFVKLFEVLAQEEAQEPETVMTESPLESSETQAEAPEAPLDEDAEVTRIKERPTFEDEEDEEEPAKDVLQTVEEEVVVPTPEPPTPPEDIETPAKTDEVTVMTAKTLDLFTTDEVSEAEESEDPADPAPDALQEISEATAHSGGLSIKSPKVGRHDLPEEFFATNEISTPINREDVPPVDDLKEMYGTSSVDDAWGELADDEDLRVTEQIESPLSKDEDDDQTLDRPLVDPTLVEESAPAEVEEVDEEVDEESDDELVGASDSEDDDEWEEEDHPDISVELLQKHASRIADVYNIPLPFTVAPSSEDEAAGLKRAKISKSEKDRRFPYPNDKTLSQAYVQTFDLSPPKAGPDKRIIAAAIVFVLLLIAIFAAM